MQIISAAFSIYMIAIVVRVVMTWFGGAQYGRVMEYLSRVTDPYLEFFRRMGVFRLGHIDFSPVIAIISLSILSNVALQIGYTARVSVGYILAIILDSLADAAGFFLFIFMVLAGIRAVALMAGANTTNRFWMMLDQLLEPLSFRLVKTIRRPETTYRNALFLFVGLSLVVLILGNFVVNAAVNGLAMLPF
jgi:YggT family protein